MLSSITRLIFKCLFRKCDSTGVNIDFIINKRWARQSNFSFRLISELRRSGIKFFEREWRRCRTKTNHARVFPHPRRFACFYKKFLIALKGILYFTFFRLAAAVFRNHLSPSTSWKQSRMVHESNNTELSKSTFSPADNRPRMHALLNGFDLNCLKPTTLHLLSSSKYFVFIRIFAPGLLRRYLKNWVGVDF